MLGPGASGNRTEEQHGKGDKDSSKQDMVSD